MYRILRDCNDDGVCFALVDPAGELVRKIYRHGSKAIIAPVSLRHLQATLNTTLVLDGGSR